MINRRRGGLLAALGFALALILGGAGALPASAAAAPVAELTLYSDGSAIGTQGSIGVFSGHAFVAVKNVSAKAITVGELEHVLPTDTVTIGTWGNKSEHVGVWYNLESDLIHGNAGAYATAALTRNLTKSDLAKLSSYVSKHDSWSVAKNCSYFAMKVWNLVSPWTEDVIAGLPATPAGLFANMTGKANVQTGTAGNIPWTSLGVWYANGKKAPKRSKAYPDSAPMVTFSELAVETAVSDQYGWKGVLFSGAPNAWVMEDGSNPTSPSLSPSDSYSGTLDIKFVNPNKPWKKTLAKSFAFDIGYLNTEGGATITWYSTSGKKLGTRKTSGTGMVRVAASGVGIARVHIDTTTDQFGAAIDNLVFVLA